MHVGVVSKCMELNFGGRGFSAFGDFLNFKMGHFSLLQCRLSIGLIRIES